jgi:CheY-like chemotaxis protein
MTFSAGDEDFVLIVDDEQDIRETLSEVAAHIGCRARSAANGAEALRMLETQRPCLIILDLRMPVMSGQETLAALRGDAALADLPVVISTSTPAEAPRGVPVLPKPIDVDKAFAWMRRYCQCPGGGASS